MSKDIIALSIELGDRNLKPAHYNYHAGLCAIGGKTTSTMEQINNTAGNLITSPSLELVQESANRVNNTHVITNNEVKQVASVIEELLLAGINPNNDPKKNPKINVSAYNGTTLDAISSMTGLFRKVANIQWNLIADEGFNNTIQGYGLQVHPIMHDTLDKLFSFVEFPDQPRALRVTSKDYDAVVKLAEGTFEDDTLSSNLTLKNICKDILDTSKHVLVSKETVTQAKARLEQNDYYKLEILSVIRADILNIFNSVTFLLAHFPLSELAIALRVQGINIEDYTVLGEAEGTYDNSERLSIKYFVPDGYSWSHTLASSKDKRTSNMDRVIANFRLAVKDLDESIIWNTWTAYRDSITDNLNALHDGHKHIINTSLAGVNHLRDYTAAAWLKARNMGDGRNVLNHFGVEPQELDFAGSVLDAYQFIMRTDLRNLKSKKPVNVIVPDKRTVNFLLTMFPDASVEFLDWGIRVPVTESTGNPVGRPAKYTHPDGTKISNNARKAFTRSGLPIDSFPDWLSNSKYKK